MELEPRWGEQKRRLNPLARWAPWTRMRLVRWRMENDAGWVSQVEIQWNHSLYDIE